MGDQFQLALENLQNYWGYPGFRDQQDEVIKSVFAGNDTLVLFPTGGGKSLCYQVPATVFDGITLVISPLVALMQDQVKQLNDRGISATFINSTLPRYEVEQRLVNARNGMYKLLYCAPERLSTTLFESELDQLNIKLIAIDEAHCISEWGHDFRPSYRTIRSSLSRIEEHVKWIALTATATPEVRKDIIENLGFKEAQVISKPFKRENLTWWVIEEENKPTRITRSIQKAANKGDGLMYGSTRKNCEFWAKKMTKLGLKSEAYHAGLDAQNRKEIQERWISGETPFVVATNAFGMGIDKPNCRYVIHEEMPYSMEAYYQEAGRAGRDGADSYPILFYKSSDYPALKSRIIENYPNWEELQKVYVALHDELGLAVGSSLEELKSYKVESVQRRCALKASVIRSSIRIMEQFGVLVTESNVASNVQLQFTLTLDQLQQFTRTIKNADKAEFLDKLIRLFGHHACSNMVHLETDFVLKRLNISRNSLIKGLNVLMQHDAVLVYSIAEGSDLVLPLGPREYKLPVPRTEVEQYRNNLLQKLEFMNGYATTNSCREVYLLNYFGESDAKNCGKCDNCVKASKEEIQYTEEDVLLISKAINQQTMSIEQISKELSWPVHKSRQIIQYLINEGRVSSVDEMPHHYQLVDRG